MSTPPGHKPPGWKRPSGMGYEIEEKQAHTVGTVLKRRYDAKQAKKAKKGFVVESVQPADEQSIHRTGDGRLRNIESGKWVKDLIPNYKRTPPIIPWNKGKKYKRKAKP